MVYSNWNCVHYVLYPTRFLKVPISLFFFRLKVLSFMNSEFEKPKKISASKYAFLSKVRNSSFDRATGDLYLWRSSSKTSFAVISVLLGKTWQTKYLKLNLSVFRCVLNRKQRNCCVDSVNIHYFIMEWMLGQKQQQSQNCLIYTFPNSKNVTGIAKNFFNFWNLVLLKGSTFHLNDKKK